MMFEMDHDGFNQFGDEAVGGRKAIYELIESSPNSWPLSQCFADESADLRVGRSGASRNSRRPER